MAMRKHPEEPKYIPTLAKFPGKCHECGDWFEAGDAIVYSPTERQAYCEGCGKELNQ